MPPAFTASQTSIKLSGKPIEGAEDRQRKIPGFDQTVFSTSSVVCIGAGGIVSQIAPTLVRKGIGRVALLDDDVVEASNLNRQRFYERDLGKNKALTLAWNLQGECIAATEIRGIPLRFEEAVARKRDLSCHVAVCGVDNNPARIAISRYFRARGVPVVFTAVSLDGDHGYIFVQESAGPCIACLFPDMLNDDRYPTMTIEQIKAMPVIELADDDAILWLWTTNAHLRLAFDVVDAWGFEYKALLTWVKDRMGTGEWLRGQTEHCLLASRGEPVFIHGTQSTVLEAARREHSRKPEEFYTLVETTCAGGKLELFSRERRNGWQTYGNDVEKFDSSSAA
jgi:N6-adenosine-specific RNA methylase IME4